MIGQQALHARAFFAVVSVAAGACCGACTPRRTTPNEAYLDPRISVETWNQLFEAEGRELSERRDLVMTLAAVKPGMTVADVGAGTGLFSMMLSDAVGARGRVYAEEVVGTFSRYLAERAAREGRDNVVSVVGTERSVGLPQGSIDLAFLCNVYHHFDYPGEMLVSIRNALRDGGDVLLIDFRREPGRSPPWVLEHVRAGEQVVLREFQAAGFTPLSTEDSLRDSYAWRLRRVGDVTPRQAGHPLAAAPDPGP